MYRVFSMIFLCFFFVFSLVHLRVKGTKKIQTTQRLSGFQLGKYLIFFKKMKQNLS